MYHITKKQSHSDHKSVSPRICLSSCMYAPFEFAVGWFGLVKISPLFSSYRSFFLPSSALLCLSKYWYAAYGQC